MTRPKMRVDIKGQVFERLTVIAFDGIDHRRRALWECVCDCGVELVVRGDALRGGHTKSCGCLNREQVAKAATTHGHHRGGGPTRTYRSWQQMKDRCYNKNNKYYKDYGGRGIKVCDRWLDKERGFENFLEDMGVRPIGKSINKINNNGNYEPNNCNWATRKEQSNNTRQNRVFSYNGVTQTIAQWARHLGVPHNTLSYRLDNWSIERALGA